MGVNINIANDNGDTPLHWAVEDNSLELCRALKQLGANSLLTNNFNQSPRDLAEIYGYDDIITIMNERLIIQRTYD